MEGGMIVITDALLGFGIWMVLLFFVLAFNMACHAND